MNIKQVPFIDLKRFESDFLMQWKEKVSVMSENAHFIGGEEVSTLENNLCDYLKVKYAISCANGTDAIQLALRAIGVGPGDKVLVPDMTFWATYEAVVNVSATPITIDCSFEDGGIDVVSFKKAIQTYKPKAALIAHLYGWGTSHLAEIRHYCLENNVLLVEDGAQCFGVDFQGESIYQNAYISTTSFYPAKVLGGAGDGGAVFTNNEELAQKVRCLSNHGREQHYGYSSVGWNSRLDSLQAAFLNLSLTHLDSRIDSRVKSANVYRELIDSPFVKVMTAPLAYKENGYCNVCHIDDKDIKQKLEAALKQYSIGFGNIYPGPLSQQKGAKETLLANVGNGVSSKYCESVLNLPLFPYMAEDEIRYVVDIVNKIGK